MKRRLAAIMALDMEGYSRRMEADEAGTLARHKACRLNKIDPSIALYNGRIVKDIGDGLLVEFISVVDAVRCAVDIQAVLAQGANGTDTDPLTYRIGINLGDVIHQDGDVFGDGVNIAARIEALADPGGIIISGTAYDHLKANIDVGYEFLGERAVKNITAPVRLYRVVPQGVGDAVRRGRFGLRKGVLAACAVVLLLVAAAWWVSRPDFVAADPAKMALPLPDGPSIAVLPFDYVGPDPSANGYLADGLSGNIIATLSRVPGLLVIARSSSFSLKGQEVAAPEVSQRFGVRHVLEGSVQLKGDKMRVSVQLVDGVGGRNVWARSFDGAIEDIFDVQDEITLAIADSIQKQVLPGTFRGGVQSRNVEAWLSVVAGWDRWQRYTPEANLEARRLFKQASDLDPDYAQALAGQGGTFFGAARFGWSSDPVEDLQRAVEFGEAALAKTNSGSPGYWVLAGSLVLLKQPERAREIVKQALVALPGDATIAGFAGWVLKYTGDAEASLPYFARAKRLEPVPRWWLLADEIGAYMDLGRFDEALVLIEAAGPKWPPAYEAHHVAWQAAAFYGAGQVEEARATAARAMEIDPLLSVRSLRQWEAAYTDPAIPERRLDLFRALGIPETPVGN